MEFPARLRAQRLSSGQTQQQVAEKIGVDTTTYAHYESGRRAPDIKKLRMLCALFGIAFEEHFPLVRTIEYPPALLKTLFDVKVQVSDELTVLESKRKSLLPHDLLLETRNLVDRLKAAIEPVQEIWESTMDAPEMDLVDLPEGQTIMRVNYRPKDWLLLSESTQLQSKVIDFMFQE